MIPTVDELKKRVEDAVASIRQQTSFQPIVGAVLGSGLGYLADQIDVEIAINYTEISGFAKPSVKGHSGRLVFGKMGDVPVAFLSGRSHLYEGHSPYDTVFPIRVLRHLGVEFLLLTNAAGGINVDFRPGDLMLIEDHINLTGRNPLIGPNVEEWGPRFPDMGGAYDSQLKEIAQTVARQQNFDLKRGVYVGLIGPSYETPAEIKMLRTLGGDAVGMSTVLEVIAARHIGMKSIAISCIANLAADIHGGELTHEEVTEAVNATKDAFGSLVKGIINEIGRSLISPQR